MLSDEIIWSHVNGHGKKGKGKKGKSAQILKPEAQGPFEALLGPLLDKEIPARYKLSSTKIPEHQLSQT